MFEVKEYYVVGLYTNEDEPPYKIYKVTTNLEDAIMVYGNYILNSNCYVGTYRNNKLIELGKYHSNSADGPGIFNGVVTMDAIDHYEISIL